MSKETKKEDNQPESSAKEKGHDENDAANRRHSDYHANYDPDSHSNQYSVGEARSANDINPRIKINYEGRNFKDTRGPRPFKGTLGGKRARVLFVTPDQYDKNPYFTYGPAYLASVLELNDYDVEIFHGTCLHLGPKDLERFLLSRKKFDFIGIGYLSNYVHDVINYIAAIRSASNPPKLRI